MKERIRILFTMPNFDRAGSGKVVYDLINGLNRDKFDIEIACRHNRGAFFKEVEKLNLPIHIIETAIDYRPYFSLYSRVRLVSKFLKKNNYDIVHSWHWSSDWTEALAARFAGIKWIYTKKAMSWGNRHWKIRSYLANYIININDEMRLYYPNKKAQSLIPLGIDTDYYAPNRETNNEKTDSIFRVITVANLVPVKGVEVLMKAIHELTDKKIKLTILGNKDNEYGESLEALSQTLNMQDRIEFLGKKPDVRPYINNADLYVIPTLDQGRKEGMPMALVEAMSMAVPIIGSDISGINFVLKDFPDLLVKAGEVTELKQKISYIMALDFDARKQLGDQLRTYCVANYTVDRFINAHEDLYTNLV